MRLEEFSSRILTCSLCLKMCKYVCPVASVVRYEPVYPPNKALIAHMILSGMINLKDEGENVARYAYLCTTCGLCSTPPWCGLDVRLWEIIEALRADLVDQGIILEPVKRVLKSASENRNPYGENLHARFSKVKHVFSDDADVVYFVGCTTSYRVPQIANAVIDVLSMAGLNFTLLKDEWCCGSPLIRLGLIDLAREHAEHNINALNDIGAKTVVFSCPGCYRTFKIDYERLGYKIKFEVKHVTEVVVDLLKSLKIRKKEDITATYHDPCHLGRHLGIFDAPRQILSVLGIQIREMQWRRENSRCCGAGGGMLITNSEVAYVAGRRRVEEALESGVKNLITACPFCRISLERASGGKIEVKDVMELLAESLEER